MLSAFLWGGIAAASLLIGFWLASRGLSNRTVGVIMGFGAGALISAIAYELIPEAAFHGWQMGIAFLIGALSFFFVDWIVDKQGGSERKSINPMEKKGSGAAIFIGTMLDNIPESLVLGMGLATGGEGVGLAFIVAVFVSNLPEGLAGTSSLEEAGRSHAQVFRMWAVLVLISAACAGLGYWLIQTLPSVTGRLAQAFAAGAMLTMIADAMMPEAFENGGKLVGFFTVIGFLVAAALSVAG